MPKDNEGRAVPSGAAEPVSDGSVSALSVIEMGATSGGLSADFEAMKVAARAYVSKVVGMDIVTDEDRKAAWKIRADLNSKVEAIEKARKDAFRAYDAPKEAFKAKCEEVKSVIKEQIAIIDGRLKELDDEFTAARKAALLAEYETQAPDLMAAIPLERFIERESALMGRSWSETKAVSKLGQMIATAVSDREAIRAAAPKFATAADKHYCERLDLSAALAEAKRLADEAKARERHAEQMQREAEDRVARAMAQAKAAEGGGAPCRPKSPASEVREWDFRFRATKAQATMIAEYAKSIGVVSDGIKGVA
ncbi:DUF1351 domain-containing protein [Adlercreutzia muris]|nr:DUF1351 domain-containing protein [Adlercreutzia muris]MCR2027740.1 DUF1351 domain-containing protein [Adlercreutzia muris]